MRSDVSIQGVRRPRPGDVAAMAALADLKRQQYRDNASPFQRPAPDALKVHEAFLARLLDWEGFVVLVHDGPDGVDGLAVARVGSAPPPFGEGAALFMSTTSGCRRLASGRAWAGTSWSKWLARLLRQERQRRSSCAAGVRSTSRRLILW